MNDTERELIELRKDRDRLDRLESEGFTTQGPGLGGVHNWGSPDGEHGWTARYVSSEFTNVRAAIDAAIGAGAK